MDEMPFPAFRSLALGDKINVVFGACAPRSAPSARSDPHTV